MFGTITKLPTVEWDKEIEALKLEKELEKDVKEKMNIYLNRMREGKECGDDE